MPGDSVVSGSGADTVDTLPYNIEIADPPLQLESPVAFSGSFVASNPGMAYTYDWHVAASNGQVIADGRGTAAVNAGAGTTSFQFTPTAAGAYAITLTITDGYGGVNQATLAETAGTVTPFHDPDRDGRQPDHGGFRHADQLDRDGRRARMRSRLTPGPSRPRPMATPPAPGSGVNLHVHADVRGELRRHHDRDRHRRGCVGVDAHGHRTLRRPDGADRWRAGERVRARRVRLLAGRRRRQPDARERSHRIVDGHGRRRLECALYRVGPERDLHARRHRVLHRHAQPA